MKAGRRTILYAHAVNDPLNPVAGKTKHMSAREMGRSRALVAAGFAPACVAIGVRWRATAGIK